MRKIYLRDYPRNFYFHFLNNVKNMNNLTRSIISKMEMTVENALGTNFRPSDRYYDIIKGL